jgi:polar amino acid transport system substrate-binding protein
LPDVMNIKVFSVFIIILLYINIAVAEVPITAIHIVSPVWENYTNEDGITGLYWEVLHSVFDPVGIDLEIETVPFKRAQKMVADNFADAIPAVSPETDTYCYKSRRCLDFLMVIALYNPKKIQEWDGIDTLRNYKVGWVRGYDYEKRIDIKMEYYELSNLENAMEMLMNGRIDIILDYITGLDAVADKINMDLTQYTTREVFPDPMYMGFAKTDHAGKLLAIYDERIESLYRSGKLQKIYWKWGYEFKKDKFEFSYAN